MLKVLAQILIFILFTGIQTVSATVSSGCREKPETCTEEETAELFYESYIETCSTVYGFKKGSTAFKNCMNIFVPGYQQ